MKKQKKNESAITLALVISIIILLILAGVSLSAVIGENGILNQAAEATVLTEETSIIEEIQLLLVTYETGKIDGSETRTLSEYIKDNLELKAIRETKYGTLIFKVGNKIVSIYNDDIEIKDYHENTLSNNAQILKVSGEDADITTEDGFLTDDGIARKYVKSITFDTSNNTPSSYDISWDVSEIQDNSVIAYASGDETNGYDVTIVADGEIYMPENSTSLFQYCGYNENLPEYEIDLTGLNAITAVNMDNTFCDFGYYSMTYFYLGDNFDTSNVTNMEGMFGRCGYTSMATLDLGDKFDTSNVTTMLNMFSNCGYTSMITLKLGDNFNTSNVKDLGNIFRYCGHNSLESLDLGEKFNTMSAQNILRAFYGCGYESMTEIYFGNAFNDTSKVTDMTFLLLKCGTSECKYYVSSEVAQTWLLNLTSSYRRSTNWTTDYIIVK